MDCCSRSWSEDEEFILSDIEDEDLITLSDLPDDIMTRILAELTPRDLARVMWVAREWSDFATKAAGLRAAALDVWLFPFRGSAAISMLHEKELLLIKREAHPLYSFRLYKKLIQRGSVPSLPVVARMPSPRRHWRLGVPPYPPHTTNMTAAFDQYIGTIAEWAVSSEAERDLVPTVM